eukprot:m51a1_g13 putative tkl protein kinase (405) ;mRNA; f:68038-70836
MVIWKDDDNVSSTLCVACSKGTHTPAASIGPGSSGPCANFTCAPGFVDHDSDPSTPCTSLCFRITSAGECNKSLLGCEWCGRYCATRSHCDCSQVLDQETCLASVNCTWCSGQSQCFPGACPVAGGARSKAAVIGGAVGGGGGAAVVLVVVGGLALGRWIRKRQKLTYHDEVDASEILMGEVIGQGSFGVVYKALWRDTEVAAKVFSVESLAAGSIAQFEKEVDHKRGYLTELMPSGNLMELLANETAIVYLRLKLSILSDIARGMAYLHQTDPPILHRDLKSSNILLDSNMQAKVSDFGLTMFSHKGAGSRDSSAVVGTIFWTAPEVLGGADCSTKSDVFSFGIIVWEVMTREVPYEELNPHTVAMQVMQNGLRPAMENKRIPPPVAELATQCWAESPEYTIL